MTVFAVFEMILTVFPVSGMTGPDVVLKLRGETEKAYIPVTVELGSREA
jgi:hypothetical protein